MAKYVVSVNDRKYTIEINRDDRVTVDGREVAVDFRCIDADSLYSLLMDHLSYEAFVEEHDGVYQVLLHGRPYTVSVEDEQHSLLLHRTTGFAPPRGEIPIKAPMPGLVVALPVTEGEIVKAGQTVVVLESMKMENELKAPRDGAVCRIRVAPREGVERGQVLMVIGECRES